MPFTRLEILAGVLNAEASEINVVGSGYKVSDLLQANMVAAIVKPVI
jgi:hypothetical protein